MLNIEVASNEDVDFWNDFVKMSDYSTPYHLWEYGESLSLTYGYRRFYLIARENGEIVGILPLIRVKSSFFGDKLISLPFCEYGGPLSKSEHVQKALLKTSISVANELGVGYVEIRSPQNDISSLDRRYCNIQRYLTFRMDLRKPAEALWSDLDKKTRNAVRKAMRKRIGVKEGKRRDLKDYYALYLKTQKKHGSPPNSFKLFSKLYELLRPMKAIRILLATYYGRTIAGILLFQFDGVVNWWGNVTEPHYRRLNATNLLLWKAIESSRESDFRIFDFGRTRRRTSIYHFKSGWSGEESNLQDYVYFVNHKKRDLPDPEVSKYRFLSRVWSIVPIIFAKRIGPRIVSGVGL